MPTPDAVDAKGHHADAARRDATSLGCLVAALAALGAGLVELAIGSGAVPVAAGVGAGLIVAGVLHVAWAVWLLRRGVIGFAGPALVLSLAAVLAWPVVLATAAGTPGWADLTRPLPLAVAAALNLAIAGTMVVHLRRTARPTPGRARAELSGAGYLACLVSAAAVIAVVVTPAIAATPAGDDAVSHGRHTLVDDDPAHDH